MGFFKRLLGICETQPPADPTCWRYAGGQIELDLSKTPELDSPGGAIRLEGRNVPLRVLVVRSDHGSLHVFPNRCTHGHRRLDPVRGEGKMRCCSLGQSEFDYHGRRVGGPAPKDLQSLNFDLRGQKVVIPLE